jgi:hypothetical protein
MRCTALITRLPPMRQQLQRPRCEQLLMPAGWAGGGGATHDDRSLMCLQIAGLAHSPVLNGATKWRCINSHARSTRPCPVIQGGGVELLQGEGVEAALWEAPSSTHHLPGANCLA